jgi:hypothetical protein
MGRRIWLSVVAGLVLLFIAAFVVRVDKFGTSGDPRGPWTGQETHFPAETGVASPALSESPALSASSMPSLSASFVVVDPAVGMAVRQSAQVRVLVTISGGTGDSRIAPGVSGAASPAAGLQPGPYRADKASALAGVGTGAAAGVHLLRDFDELPIVLVQLDNPAALGWLSGRVGVQRIQLDGRMSVAS